MVSLLKQNTLPEPKLQVSLDRVESIAELFVIMGLMNILWTVRACNV